jgi:hypothetical protein
VIANFDCKHNELLESKKCAGKECRLVDCNDA